MHTNQFYSKFFLKSYVECLSWISLKVKLKTIKIIFPICIGLFLIATVQCQTSCFDRPGRFTTFQAAISSVKSTSFKYVESINTSGSSWIEKLVYYSCDGKTGYLIMGTKGREYIHADLPIDIWNRLKVAQSKGKFYNNQIRFKYKMNLSKS